MLKMPVKLIYVSLLFFILVSCKANAVDEKKLMPTLHISSYKNAKISDRYKKLLTFSYNQLGYRIQFHEMVVSRALKMIKLYQLDALMAQTSTLMKYEDLPVIKVPVLLGKGKLVLFCKKTLLCNIKVLENPNNIIAVAHGTLGAKTDFLKMNASTYEIATKDAAGKMLALGRLNYLIIIVEESMGNLAGLDERKYGQVELAPVEGFHYIHEKHEKLIPQLSAAMELYIEQFEPSLKINK